MTDDAEVAKELTRQLGTAEWQVSRAHAFAGNEVFLASGGPLQVVLKIAEPGGLAAEAAVSELVRACGVPAPEVLALHPGGEEIAPYILMRHVGGVPVDPIDPTLRDVGIHLRAVHDIELTGFGALESSGPQLIGTRPSWAQWAREGVDGLAPVVTAGLLPIELLSAIETRVARHTDVLAGIPEARLLHGDVHPRHVYADAGRLTGIIDWGDAIAGDPLFDLGRILRADAQSLSLILEGYGGLDYRGDDLRRRLHLYAVVFTVGSIVSEFKAGAPWPEWFEHQARALATHLEAL